MLYIFIERRHRSDASGNAAEHEPIVRVPARRRSEHFLRIQDHEKPIIFLEQILHRRGQRRHITRRADRFRRHREKRKIMSILRYDRRIVTRPRVRVHQIRLRSDRNNRRRTNNESVNQSPPHPAPQDSLRFPLPNCAYPRRAPFSISAFDVSDFRVRV